MRDLLWVLLIIFFMAFIYAIGIFGLSIIMHKWAMNPWILAMLTIGTLGLAIVDIIALYESRN